MKSVSILVVAGFAAAASAATATKMGVEVPSSAPITKQAVVQGCFSSAGSLKLNSTQTYNSAGQCGQVICQALGFFVAASTEGDQCYCGNSYPPKSSLVDDSKCDSPCTGYGQDACGGYGFFTVYNTGLKLSGIAYADSDDDDTSSSAPASSHSSTVAPTSTAAAKPSTVATTVVGGQTVFVTQTSSAEPKKSSGTNTAGIAGGVVAGVVVIGAVVGGAFFMMRRRRNREIEEEHRRNAAVNAFFSGSGKTPSTNGDYTAADARLDPVMAQRRMSSGSIADNEDYSRRILRVTNA